MDYHVLFGFAFGCSFGMLVAGPACYFIGGMVMKWCIENE